MKKGLKEKTENAQVSTLEREDEALVAEPKEISKSKAETKDTPIIYHENAKVICSSCATTFTVGSTKPEIHVEVCSNCHPFFTGQAKFVDTEGRVEAFRRREGAKQDKKEKKAAEPQKPERPKSLKEMLEILQSS